MYKKKCDTILEEVSSLFLIGDYDKVEEKLKEAKNLNIFYAPIYKWAAKIDILNENYPRAFQNLLTYAHLFANNISFYGNDKKEYLTVEEMHKYYDWGNSVISPDIVIEEFTINLILMNIVEFFVLSRDLELSLLSGYLTLLKYPSIIDYNNITINDINKYKLAIINNNIIDELKDDQISKLYALIGFLAIFYGLKLSIREDLEIIYYYFENNIEPKLKYFSSADEYLRLVFLTYENEVSHIEHKLSAIRHLVFINIALVTGLYNVFCGYHKITKQHIESDEFKNLGYIPFKYATTEGIRKDFLANLNFEDNNNYLCYLMVPTDKIDQDLKSIALKLTVKGLIETIAKQDIILQFNKVYYNHSTYYLYKWFDAIPKGYSNKINFS